MDRLTIINDALIATGNNTLDVEFDGSPEWRAADSSYRRAVSRIVGLHSWNFATRGAPLSNILLESPSPALPYAFGVPGDCLHVDGLTDENGTPYTAFEIIDNAICIRSPCTLFLRYVRIPENSNFPPCFVEAVCVQVEANLLRALNEDMDTARRRDVDAENEVARARNRTDQQQPARKLFRSRVMEARRGAGCGRRGTAYGSGPLNIVVDGGGD